MNQNQQNQNPGTINPAAAVVVTLHGETRPATFATWQDVADAMVRDLGPGVPSVRLVEPATRAEMPGESVPATRAEMPGESVPAPAAPADDASVDGVGALRSLLDMGGAVAAGFSPADPIYERGTRVNAIGVENARRSRLDHEAKPTVAEYCAEFVEQIAKENRTDRAVPLRDLRMREDGNITRTGREATALPIAEPAFLALANRLGLRGARYLADLPPNRRASNLHLDVADFARREDLAIANGDAKRAREVVLRIRRKANNGPEVYAAVGSRYAAFDADRVAQAIALASPADARGGVTYDGRRSRFEIVFHSNVQPERYVAGEFFKAGVLVTTDDTGAGGLQVKACIWQNLCRNLIILDRSVQEIATLRHVGDVERLAGAFRDAMAKALGTLTHFRKAWGYALDENIAERAREEHAVTSLDVEAIMRGTFHGLIDADLVPLPRVASKREGVVNDLMTMWAKDTSAAAGPSRAGVVNALTRYAHEINEDPWKADEIQSAAGALLFGRGGAAPKALPFLAMA